MGLEEGFERVESKIIIYSVKNDVPCTRGKMEESLETVEGGADQGAAIIESRP